MTIDLADLAGLDQATRASLLQAVSALPARCGPSVALTATLGVVRDVLRERHPIRRDQIHVDVLVELGPHRWAMEGWTARRDVTLTALTPEGETVRLGAQAGPDGRFAAVVSPQSPSSRQGWVLIAAGDEGAIETPELRAVNREQVLGRARTFQFGPSPSRPECAVVVRLDREAELLEHHLAWLEDDPALRGAEVVCVLDGPADPERARWRAGQLHALYGRAMTLVVLPVRAGRLIMLEAGMAQVSAGEIRCTDWPGRWA